MFSALVSAPLWLLPDHLHNVAKMLSETETMQRPQATGMSGRALLVILVSAALTMVDFFIVNVALAPMGAEFGASPGTLEWVVVGYGGAYSVLLVFGGRLGDIWGRRRTAFIGLLGFTIMSAVCGLAPSIAILIPARILQGGFAAFLLPQTLATIHAVAEAGQKGRAIGWYGAVGGLSAALGQVLGGVLASGNLWGLGWRPVFLINIPIGILLLLGMVWVPESRAATKPRIDWSGTALFGIAMATCVMPLLLGSSLGWPWWAWLSLIVAAGATAALIGVERFIERGNGDPLIPPSLFRLTGVRRGLLFLAALGAAFGGNVFAFSITLQAGRGFSPLSSGLSLLPMAVGAFIASLLSARLIARLGTKTVALGGTVQALGLAVIAATTNVWWPLLTPWHFLVGMFLVGVGNGLLLTTLYRVVLSGVPSDQAGAASGVLNTAQQTSMALGVALIGTVFTTLQGTHGSETGFITVTLVWAVVAALAALLSTRLPELTSPSTPKTPNQRPESAPPATLQGSPQN